MMGNGFGMWAADAATAAIAANHTRAVGMNLAVSNSSAHSGTEAVFISNAPVIIMCMMDCYQHSSWCSFSSCKALLCFLKSACFLARISWRLSALLPMYAQD